MARASEKRWCKITEPYDRLIVITTTSSHTTPFLRPRAGAT